MFAHVYNCIRTRVRADTIIVITNYDSGIVLFEQRASYEVAVCVGLDIGAAAVVFARDGATPPPRNGTTAAADRLSPWYTVISLEVNMAAIKGRRARADEPNHSAPGRDGP